MAAAHPGITLLRGMANQWWPAVVAAVLIILTLAWFFLFAISQRGLHLDEARSMLRSRSDIAAIEVIRSVESADMLLQTVIALIDSNPSWQSLPNDPMLWRMLHNIATAIGVVPQVLIVDETGSLRLHSDQQVPQRLRLSDREYFIYHRDSVTSAPLVGQPITGRVTNHDSIPLSRRLSWPDGGFKGVAMTNLSPERIGDFFRSLDNNEEIVLTLLREDGIILLRHPATDHAAGSHLDVIKLYRDARAGDRDVVVSPIDGIERLFRVKTLPPYNLEIIASIPVKTALAPWRQETERLAAITGVAIVLIILASVLLIRHIRAENKTSARLAASENSLNRAQAVARVGSWQAHLPGLRLTASDEACRLFALPRGQFDFHDVLARIDPDDRRMVMRAIRQTMRGIAVNLEHRLRIDGGVSWVRLRAEITQGDGDGPAEIVGTVQDITELRQAEESLRRQADELAKSNTELEQFAYIASHDLREPLRMINSFLDLLTRRYGDRLDQDAREFIGFSREGAQRMDRLVLDLLDYSRIGRVCRPLEPIDLAPVLARSLQALSLKITETRATVTPPPHMPPRVTGDPDELVRLFQNVIDNALKYADPSRPPRIDIQAGVKGSEVEITVSDNGIGIEPQYFERIFRIFQRLHTRESYDGTGIGLAICKKIVERHGGRIWLDSLPGQGSAFHFTLMRADPW